MAFRAFVPGLIVLLLILGTVTAPPAVADDDVEREVRAVKAQIEKLWKEAHKLADEGHEKEAKEVKARADDLERRLKAFFARREEGEHKHKHKQEQDGARRERILKGLAQGMEALHALGKKEEAAHLKRIYMELKQRVGKYAAHGEKRQTERQIVEGWIELMGYGVKVLAKAGKEDRAHILEHGKHALELALANKRDAKSMKIRKSAPPRVKQAHCLAVAAEILADQGDKRHAELMAKLAHRWRKQADRRKGKEAGESATASLGNRVEIMMMSLPILKEAGKKKAAAILERGIATGKVMLAERDDAEAREIRERTPKLGELAEVLWLASKLWAKHDDERKAKYAGALAEYYKKRWAEQNKEREDRAHRGDEGDEDVEIELEKRKPHHPGELEELHEQMQEMREMLEKMRRRLEEIARRK